MVDPETGELREPPRRPRSTARSSMEFRDQIEERDVTPDDFGRIAAQTAKQVILQRIREAERDMMFDEYQDRVGELITGIVQQSDSRYTLVQLRERVEALLPKSEQVDNERYDHGAAREGRDHRRLAQAKGPSIIVSRRSPELIRKLFELEVPEIADGLVEIQNVAREPGYRSKIAVVSHAKRRRPGRRLRGPARLARAHGRVRAARREDRHHPLQRGARPLRRQGALARARARGARGRRGQAGHRHRARRPALAGDRQGGPERPPRRPAHRLAGGHPLRDRVRRGGGGDGLRGGGAVRAAAPRSSRTAAAARTPRCPARATAACPPTRRWRTRTPTRWRCPRSRERGAGAVAEEAPAAGEERLRRRGAAPRRPLPPRRLPRASAPRGARPAEEPSSRRARRERSPPRSSPRRGRRAGGGGARAESRRPAEEPTTSPPEAGDRGRPRSDRPREAPGVARRAAAALRRLRALAPEGELVRFVRDGARASGRTRTRRGRGAAPTLPRTRVRRAAVAAGASTARSGRRDVSDDPLDLIDRMAKKRVHEIAKERGIPSQGGHRDAPEGRPRREGGRLERGRGRHRARLRPARADGNGAGAAAAAGGAAASADGGAAGRGAGDGAERPPARRQAPARRGRAARAGARRRSGGRRRRVVIDSQAARRARGPAAAAAARRAAAAAAGAARRGSSPTSRAEPEAPQEAAAHRRSTPAPPSRRSRSRSASPPPEVIKKLMELGEMATLTQTLTDEAIEVLAEEFDKKVEIVHAADEVEEEPEFEDAEDDARGAPAGRHDHGPRRPRQDLAARRHPRDRGRRRARPAASPSTSAPTRCTTTATRSPSSTPPATRRSPPCAPAARRSPTSR